MLDSRCLRSALASALIWIAGALALAGCSAAPPPEPTLEPKSTRSTASGRITGFANVYGGYSWLGIPFATPPVGPQRWQPPQPAAAWQGDRDARKRGPACVQLGSPLGGIGEPGSQQGSEDCLYLDVYAPALGGDAAARARLPVMVWIHGGGNTVGHAGFFDGGRLAVSQNVVVVVIQYRLGPFGWFVLPGSRGADVVPTAANSGNWGTLDTIAALSWVKQHIAPFGGSPDNVTVFGESAGGTNTLALLVSPFAQNLFQRVIAQSGGLGFASVEQALHFADDAAPGEATSSSEILATLLISQGKAKDRAAAKAQITGMTAEQAASFLRGLDTWTVFNAYLGTGQAGLLGPRVPAVIRDGAVLRDGDTLALLADPTQHNDVPTLLGTNRDEPKIFMAFDPANVTRMFGIPLWTKDAATYDRDARYGALSWKLRGVDDIARRLAAQGAPAFAYRFDYDDWGTRFGMVDLGHILGAAHGLEIPFVFGHFDVGPQSALLFTEDNAPGRTRLSDAMMSYWAQFAATGDPGRGRRGELPPWQAWSATAGGAKAMLLDVDSSAGGPGLRMTNEDVTAESLLAAMEAESGDDTARCALFDRTFRFDGDGWTKDARARFAGGRCPPRGADAP